MINEKKNEGKLIWISHDGHDFKHLGRTSVKFDYDRDVRKGGFDKMKRMPKTYFVHDIATWLFVSALLTLLAIFTYGIIYAIIVQSKLPVFFNYIGAGAVIIAYVALVILSFINFVIDA